MQGEATSQNTAAGMVLGTPRYMAPEQATGKALSPATDVYAVGCVLFEMLIGAPLFEGRDARELLWNHLNTPAPSLSVRALRAFDPQLEAVVARALHKDPFQRYARAADFAAALRSLVFRTSVAPPRIIKADDRATVKVEASPLPPEAHPTAQLSDAEALADTRAIPAMNLVHGVSTTEQAPIITAQTEVLGEPPGTGGTGALAAEVSTTPIERRAMPLWPFAVGLFFFAGTIGGLLLLLRASEDPRPEKPAAVAASKPEPPTPTPTPSPTTKPEPETPKPEPTPKATHAPGPVTKPTATATPSAAPAPSASAAINNYDHAKQLMADGDLDAAEREARLAISTHGIAARLLLGEIFERKGKPLLAKEVYKKILEIDPNNGPAKTRLAKLGG